MIYLRKRCLNWFRKPKERIYGGNIFFYPFGGSGSSEEYVGGNRRLIESGSWESWAKQVIDEVPDNIERIWLHNPFGIYEYEGGDREMWINQWNTAKKYLSWKLTNNKEFQKGMNILHKRFKEVICYVGSPLTLDTISFREVFKNIRPLIDSGVSIGFDASYDWHKGDKFDKVIQKLRKLGHRIYIEPAFLKDREYGEIDGIVYLDRFYDNLNNKDNSKFELSNKVENVVIQRNYDTKQLTELFYKGKTLAIRSNREDAQELAKLKF